MDALSEVLKTVHLESAVCRRIELSAPWGWQMESYDGAVFFVITRGSCWLEADGLEIPLPLAGGDLVVLPRGQRHALRDDPKSPDVEGQDGLVAADEALQAFHLGGSGRSTTLVYGRFHLEEPTVNPLLTALPPLILVRGEEGQAVEWLNTTMQFIAGEMAANRPGAQTVISHLSGIIFIQAVRAYIVNKESCGRCWLRALTDPQIGVALTSIHRHAEKPWTVAALASQVGMSRSAFATQFREIVGEPPLQYLTRWRMHKAGGLLRLGKKPLAEVATLVGYESEAAFSNAFKRWMNQSPGTYRQAARVGCAAKTF